MATADAAAIHSLCAREDLNLHTLNGRYHLKVVRLASFATRALVYQDETLSLSCRPIIAKDALIFNFFRVRHITASE
jgi:hypothetical protein